jgi:hypothetical protein
MHRLRNRQGNVTQDELDERVRLARAYVDMTTVMSDMAFSGSAVASLEALLLVACVLVGEIDGTPTTITKLARHSRLSRATIYRRIDDLIELKKVERVGTRYYLSENAISADKQHKLRRIIDALCGP